MAAALEMVERIQQKEVYGRRLLTEERSMTRRGERI